MNKLFKIIFFGVISLLTLVIIVVLVLSSSFGENYMKDWLESQLTEEIGLPVSIKEFNTNIWSHIQINTLTIDSTVDMENSPSLFVGQIRVEYSLFDLLGETIALKGLAIDSVVLGVVFDSQGHFGIPLFDNLVADTNDSNESKEFLVIDSISLSRINLSYLDSQVPMSIKLNDATLNVQHENSSGYSAQLTVDTIITKYDSLFLYSKNFEMNTSIDGDSLQIDGLPPQKRIRS